MDLNERIVVFDVETGGLDPNRHPVIQFAAIACDGLWGEVESMELKIKFDPKTADPKALEVNHYNPEVWATEAVAESRALDWIAQFFRRHATVSKISAQKKPYTVARICAHNAPFDSGFLAAWFKRAGVFCPAACFEPLCTLNLARWLTLGAPNPPANHKLGTLCEWLGIDLPAEEAHDALADVRATVQLARMLTAALGLAGGGRD